MAVVVDLIIDLFSIIRQRGLVPLILSVLEWVGCMHECRVSFWMPIFWKRVKILQRYTPTQPSVISAPPPPFSCWVKHPSHALKPILSSFVKYDQALRPSVWDADKKENNQQFCCCFDVYNSRLVLHHRLLAAMKNPRKKETGMNLKQKVAAWLTLKDQSRKFTLSL